MSCYLADFVTSFSCKALKGCAPCQCTVEQDYESQIGCSLYICMFPLYASAKCPYFKLVGSGDSEYLGIKSP